MVVLAATIRAGGLERPRALVGTPVEEPDQRLVDADHLAAVVAAQRLAHSRGLAHGSMDARTSGSEILITYQGESSPRMARGNRGSAARSGG